MKTLVVVPMKDAAESKSRLADALSPQRRSELALAMFDGVQTFFGSHFASFDRLVVTPSSDIAARSTAAGARVVLEPTQDGLNQAASRGLRWARESGCERLLLVPGDIPVWLRHEVDALLAAGATHDVVLARAHDGGTNALLLNLRRVQSFEFRYGEASAVRHEQACRRRRLACRVLTLPLLSRDIDTVKDFSPMVPALRH